MALALLSVFACACSAEHTPKPPDPQSVLQAIPAADPAQYGHIQDMRKWRNPYLIVRADGVVLFDSGNNMEMQLKPEEVVTALAELPASAWPYGRVVAVAEVGTRTSEEDSVAIRRNKGIIGGMLEGAHIVVKWVPSA